jgi:hypothetical protein
LDGFDECLRRVPSLALLVVEQLRSLDAPLFDVVISCRTAVWPSRMEEDLRRVLRAGSDTTTAGSDDTQTVAVYELAPLRRADIRRVVEGEGLDAGAFLTSVEQVGVATMASKPITLNMLIREAKAGRPITAMAGSQTALYGRGVLELCEEHDRRGPRDPAALGARQLVLVAGRIAAMMALTGLDGVWTGRATECPDDALDVSDLDRGIERAGEEQVRVDRDALDQAFGTALFTSRGVERLGFAHQTYMEYLAAQALADRPPHSVRQLIQHSDGTPVESLRGVSAWLIALRPEYGDLAERDPVMFAASGVEIPEPAIRAAVVAGVLDKARSGSLASFRSRDYWSLRHPDLAAQIIPVLNNRQDELDARYLAVQLAELTGQQLEPDLLRIGLDPTDSEEIRTATIMVLARIAGPDTRAALVPLVSDPGEDRLDGVKGAALEACFGHSLGLAECLQALTPPKVTNHSGTYRNFVGQTLPRACGAADLDVLLGWATARVGPDWPASWLAELWDKMVELAWQHIAQPQVRDRLAVLIAKRPAGEPLLMAFGARTRPLPPLTTADRRALLQAIAVELAGADHAAAVTTHAPLLDPEDLPWLLQRADQAHHAGVAGEAAFFLDLVQWVFNPQIRSHRDAIDGIGEDSWLYEKFAKAWTEAVPLDSDLARSLRRRWFPRTQADQKPPASGVSEADLRQRLVTLTADLGDRLVEAWWQLNLWLSVEPGTAVSYDFAEDLTAMPGWDLLTLETRARIIELAPRYLEEAGPDVPDAIRNDTALRPVLSGYRAAALLQRRHAAALDTLSEQAWQRWAGIIVAFPTQNPSTDSDNVQAALIRRAYERARDSVIDIIRLLVRQPIARVRSTLRAEALRPIFDTDIAAVLTEAIADDHTPDDVRQHLYQVLVDVQAPQAIDIALNAIQPVAGTQRPAWAVPITSAAIHGQTEPVWSTFAAAIAHDPAFGRQVLFTLGPETETVLSRLSCDDLADMFLWMANEVPPANLPTSGFLTPEQYAAHAAAGIPRLLAQRATPEAIDGLRHISANAPPNQKWVNRFLDVAERELRRAHRPAIKASTAAELLRNTDRRVALDIEQLSAITVESLGRLQTRLTGQITPQAFVLWDERSRRPKHEDRISDYTADHLRRDLCERGIIVDREVEVTRRTGSGIGDRNDIAVQAANETDTLKITIEIKGCFHRDVQTAMRNQLVEQYLAPTGEHHGIYLVFWFDPAQWDPGDDGRRRSAAITIEDLTAILQQQADDLAAEGWHIQPVIIDASIKFAGRHS